MIIISVLIYVNAVKNIWCYFSVIYLNNFYKQMEWLNFFVI